MVAGPSYIIMLVSIYQLVRTARASRDETQIARYTLLAAAIVIILIGGSLNFTELGQYPVDIMANILAAVIITIAILRHKLLDISVVIRKSALYVIPTVIVGAIYFLLITLALEVFHADSSERLFSVSIVVSMIAALLIQPFRDYLQSAVDKIFFRERYNAIQMLQRVSQIASSVIDLQELTHMILQEITETMYIEKAALFLKYNGKRNLMIASQIGTRISPRTIITADHPLVNKLADNTAVLTHPELAVDQKFRSAWEGEKEVITKLGAEIYVPLNVKGELVGMFSFGPKLSDQSYTSEDKQTLLTLAQQTGVAV
ncbi:MAG: GAF domain-containing protein [Chloroflexi bacterium]|nr:GAF domain-containing protein [Chloroflexota bacterium]